MSSRLVGQDHVPVVKQAASEQLEILHLGYGLEHRSALAEDDRANDDLELINQTRLSTLRDDRAASKDGERRSIGRLEFRNLVDQISREERCIVPCRLIECRRKDVFR